MKTLDVSVSDDEMVELQRDTPAPAPRMPTPLAAAAAAHPPRHDQGPVTLYDKIEAFISRLSVRDNFWHSICSLLWLPLAFFSGIKMKEIDPQTFAAYLPFRRFNR
ncbi:MAG: hypothetical protein JWL69_1227, partial [Phycisphaerales bacterium]|nr:hypothetical protein [Phycisphaerales bacterium]